MPLFFNQFKSISYQEQEEILSNLPDGVEPDVVCGGSTTNSLAATSNFGSNCAHICQLANDDIWQGLREDYLPDERDQSVRREWQDH